MRSINEVIETFKKKVIFSDLDGTLIETKSGKTFPKDIDDWKFKDDAIKAIENYYPNELYIVTNQGGIAHGFFTEDQFKVKIKNIVTQLKDKLPCEINYDYCASEDKSNPDRKPNTGMIDKYFEKNNLISKKSCIMIGDASGKKGQFSDSDKKCAENASIKYYDIEDFIKKYI